MREARQALLQKSQETHVSFRLLRRPLADRCMHIETHAYRMCWRSYGTVGSVCGFCPGEPRKHIGQPIDAHDASNDDNISDSDDDHSSDVPLDAITMPKTPALRRCKHCGEHAYWRHGLCTTPGCVGASVERTQMCTRRVSSTRSPSSIRKLHHIHSNIH